METFPSGNDCCRVSKIGHGGIKNSCFMSFLHWVKWWSRAGRSLEWPNWDCLIKNWDILGYHISFVGSSFFRNLPYVSPEMCRKSINPIPLWKKTAPRNHGLFGARSLHRWLEPSTMRVFHFFFFLISQQTTHVKAIDDCWSTAENWYIYTEQKQNIWVYRILTRTRPVWKWG